VTVVVDCYDEHRQCAQTRLCDMYIAITSSQMDARMYSRSSQSNTEGHSVYQHTHHRAIRFMPVLVIWQGYNGFNGCQILDPAPRSVRRAPACVRC
jgi:hypothetical protein